MLERIDMDVVHMMAVILLVTNKMLPESSLPDVGLTFGVDAHFAANLLA